MSKVYDTIIVGAGLAGLACAQTLDQAGQSVLLIEASDRIGGRLRTDQVDGFCLDHGFQVLLTSYPTAVELLDFSELRLGPFMPGARLYQGRQFQTVADPLRQPMKIWSTLSSNIGTLKDKFKIISLIRSLRGRQQQTRLTAQSTRIFLEKVGFSSRFIEAFFTPFYGGIFLEENLETSAAVFAYTFERFSKGIATIPAGGMSAIPQQMATGLRKTTTLLNTSVTAVDYQSVRASDGETYRADDIVLATPFHVTNELLKRPTARDWKGTTCLYFSAPNAPYSEPILALNAQSTGCVNLVCVPSVITSDMAPEGQSLICVSLRAMDQAIEPKAVVDELRMWFGTCVEEWVHLKTYHVEHALPSSRPEDLSMTRLGAPIERVHVCGDHVELATIEHALRSGRQAALDIIGTN